MPAFTNIVYILVPFPRKSTTAKILDVPRFCHKNQGIVMQRIAVGSRERLNDQ